MLAQRFLAPFSSQLFITVVIGLQPEPALAVGTWGGADPPIADDMALSLPWWAFLAATFAAVALQFLGGKAFALVGVLWVGAIVEGWLGSTAGWVAALAFGAWLYKTFYANDEKEDQKAPRIASTDWQQSESPQPREEPLIQDQKAPLKASDTPPIEVSATVRRISELRKRIDKEATRNDGTDNTTQLNDHGSDSRRRLK